MKITHEINMDLARHHDIFVDLVQGCTSTHALRFQLLEGKRPWLIPRDAAVVIRYQKPNRKTGAYDTLTDGSRAYTIQGSTVTVTIVPDVLTVSGEGALTVSLIRAEEVLTTFAVTLRIQATPGYDSDLSAHPGCITGLLPAPETAQTGQYIVVESVTEDGKITGTTAVDLTELAAEPSQSSWYVNDESDPAYVKGRTHWTEVSLDTVLAEAEYVFTDNTSFIQKAVSLTPGDYYIVTYDGIDYECVCVSATYKGLAALALGNLAAVGGEDTGGPFAFGVIESEGISAFFSLDNAQAHIAAITHVVEGAVHKLDNKYIDAEWMATRTIGRGEAIFPETTLTLDTASTPPSYMREGLLPITAGEVYLVVIDGTEYVCECSHQQIGGIEADVLGNARVWGSSYPDSGEPFLIAEVDDAGISIFICSDADTLTHTFAVYKAALVPNKLPEEFLPSPQPLTINGIVYDGSEPVEITVEGGTTTDGEIQTVLSDNLFDKTTVTEGQLFYHSSSGPQLTDSTDVCWAYVPLRGAGTYRTKVNNQEHGNYAARVPILTEDKTFIQNVTGTVTETDNKYAADLEFTITQDMVDSGAALYAFDCHTSILGTVMIVKDREYPSAYIPYGYIEVAVDDSTLADKHNNILKGKTAVFLGDSICAGTTISGDCYGYGWAGLIGEANGMNWTNYGRNGGTIVPMESVDEARWVLTQADIAHAAYPDADYVIFEGGCNDADTLKADGLGTLSASGYAPESTVDFTSAFESLVLKLLTNFPGARIGYVIPQKMNVSNDYSAASNYERIYFDRAMEICEKWGIPVLDLWKTCPMNPKLTMFYDSTLTDDENCYTDGQHLTLKGYQRITPKIEAFMRSL